MQTLQRNRAFEPRLLSHGSRVAFLCDAKGTGKYLRPMLQGIGQGYWLGVVSSVSLMRVLEGPLACGDEALAQRYANTFVDGRHWQLANPDTTINAIYSDLSVLITDHPALAQTGQHPVLSALRI